MSKTRTVSKKSKGNKTRGRKSRGGVFSFASLPEVESTHDLNTTYVFGGGLLLLLGLGILGLSVNSGGSNSHRTVL